MADINALRQDLNQLNNDLALEREKCALLQSISTAVTERRRLMTLNQELKRDRSMQAAKHRSPLVKFFSDQAQYYTVFDRLSQYLEPQDMLIISRTCKDLSNFYSDLLPRKWNVDRRLLRFVDNPKAFRSQLAQAEALISGSFALQFFAQLLWADSSLDIFVSDGDGAVSMTEYFENEGYVLERKILPFGSIEEVCYTLEGCKSEADNQNFNVYHAPDKALKGLAPHVNITVTFASPLYTILTEASFTSFHANIISWDKAYCLFPKSLCLAKRMFFLEDPDSSIGIILGRYIARGHSTADQLEWDTSKFYEVMETIYSHDGMFPKGRRIGDPNTWTISLDCQGVKNCGMSKQVLESSGFTVQWLREVDYKYVGSTDEHTYEGLQKFRLKALPFSCCTLRHSYILPDEQCYLFFREALNKYMSFEIIKHSEEVVSYEAPHWTRSLDKCPRLANNDAWKRPNSWECVDHIMPKLYEAYHKKVCDDMKQASARHHLNALLDI